MADRLVAELREKFGIENVVGFDLGAGGMPRIVITSPRGDAHIYLHGAHVTHYGRRGQSPLLFLSEKSFFQSDKPIRGGVPICWPWFGADKNDPQGPIHGMARLSEWKLQNVAQKPSGEIEITLGLEPADLSGGRWPHEFSLRYTVTVGEHLDLSLTTTNIGDDPFTFEEALHTYFAISEVRTVQLNGLGGLPYTSKAPPAGPAEPKTDPLLFAGETDSVYTDTEAECTIIDPQEGRMISIKKSGSQSTVVWNPWSEKARAMADMGDDEWPRMLCVEAGNVWHNAIRLAAGESHTLRQKIESKR